MEDGIHFLTMMKIEYEDSKINASYEKSLGGLIPIMHRTPARTALFLTLIPTSIITLVEL